MKLITHRVVDFMDEDENAHSRTIGKILFAKDIKIKATKRES